MIKTQREFKALLVGILVGLLLVLTVVGFWLYPKSIFLVLIAVMILVPAIGIGFTVKTTWFDYLPKGDDCDEGRF